MIILGPHNEYVATFNLTEHNLSDAANYEILMAMLLAAAGEWAVR